nr:putative ribonuclease H-like domain-containing protein [Tanacetum cinerariifolium]
MALPNEHLLTFSQDKDAKTLFEAIQARFDGNDAIKKTQKTIMKQMYKNFNAPSTYTNEVDIASIQVSATSIPVSTASSPNNTANLSDAIVYAFFANQPNRSQLVHEDLEQIHEDDLEEIDLKWQLALLSMRPRRSRRSQETRPRNQDSSRKTLIVKDTSSKAMMAIDGAGFDWSYMGDDEVPTNVAFMAFSDSECDKCFGKQGSNDVKSLACWIWRPKIKVQDHVSKNSGSYICKRFDNVDPEGRLNGCSRHIIGNKSFLSDNQEYNGGFVAFVGSFKGGKITGKGKIRIGKLDFEDVYFVKELKFNLFSVSQMCDKKNSVLFTETECLILSSVFKLPDENKVLLKFPKKNNMYSFDLKNFLPSKDLTCLFLNATNDESNLWHRRLGHINFKTMNKLMNGKHVRGLPLKIFEKDHTCVAFQMGKKNKASCKSKLVNYVSQPLQILHMVLFGPTFINNFMGKMYCLMVTNDYTRFSWVFFLAKEDETCGILKDFITGIENQLNHKFKIIKCDNRTEFKNYEMNQFYGIKGIKREFSNVRTPQQNIVAKRKNRTLIKAARTMLADSLLPIPFWAKAVNTACYVQNRVLVTEPYNKTPYELLIGREPIISFMRPFGCPITILNTLDHLGKFDGKANEGFLVGYFINRKDFRVYNSRTKNAEENLHVNFIENKPNVTGSGPEWLFDINSLTNSMNYQPVSVGNRTNGIACSKIHSNVGQDEKEKVSDQEYILLPVLNTSSDVPLCNKEVESSPKDDAGKKLINKPTCVEGGKIDDLGCLDQQIKSTYDSENTNSTNSFNTASPTVNIASDKHGTFQRTYGKWNFSTPILVNVVGSSFSHPAALDNFSKIPNLEDTESLMMIMMIEMRV